MAQRVDYKTEDFKQDRKPPAGLTVEGARERLARLDDKLGVDKGARSERAMLQRVIGKPKEADKGDGRTAERKPRRGGRRNKKTNGDS